jgi:hypothetical protein
MSVVIWYALISLHILSLSVIKVESKCSVREPSGVTSSPRHGDAGFQLSINEEPEFYEERNLYTITLKVQRKYTKDNKKYSKGTL